MRATELFKGIGDRLTRGVARKGWAIVVAAGVGVAAVAGVVMRMALKTNLRSRASALASDATTGEESATRSHHRHKTHLNSHDRRERAPAPS